MKMLKFKRNPALNDGVRVMIVENADGFDPVFVGKIGTIVGFVDVENSYLVKIRPLPGADPYYYDQRDEEGAYATTWWHESEIAQVTIHVVADGDFAIDCENVKVYTEDDIIELEEMGNKIEVWDSMEEWSEFKLSCYKLPGE